MIARRPAATIAVLLLAMAAASAVVRRVTVPDVPEAHAVRSQHTPNFAQNVYRVLDVHLDGGFQTKGAAPSTTFYASTTEWYLYVRRYFSTRMRVVIPELVSLLKCARVSHGSHLVIMFAILATAPHQFLFTIILSQPPVGRRSHDALHGVIRQRHGSRAGLDT